MRYKSTSAALIKGIGESDGPDDAGIFEAIVSVFGVVDYDNDMVKPGAFAKCIKTWSKSQDTMPVLWHHRLDDPRYNIGAVIDRAEVYAGDERIPKWASPELKANGGLWIKGRVDTGDDASEIARQALKILQRRRTTQFSYGYDIVRGSKSTGTGPNELHELYVYEISPTQVPSNTHTTLVAAKSDDDAPETAKRWPGAMKARAECDLLVADLETDEIAYWSL